MNLSDTDKKKLKEALNQMSDSMSRQDAERDYQKNLTNDLCEELQLQTKVFRKLARVFHKQNFEDEVAANDEFEKLYESLTKPTTP